MSFRTPRTKASRLERRQILTDAPIIWDELSKTITEVEDLEDLCGLRPGFVRVRDSTRLAPPSVTLSTTDRKVRVTYYKRTPKITYEVKERRGKKSRIVSGTFTFRRHSGETWMSDEKHSVLDLPDVLKQLVEYLV